MAKKQLVFSVYSIRELTADIRPKFKIPHYPFAKSPSGPLSPETLAYFQDLGIVHYRDEVSPLGITIKPNDGDSTPIYERSGFLAYKSVGLIGFKSLEILRWSAEKDPGKFRRLQARWGDDHTWMWWNRPFTIRLMTESEVRTS